MLKSDADAKAMLNKYKVQMPNQGLNRAEVANYLKYFHWVDAQPANAVHTEGAH